MDKELKGALRRDRNARKDSDIDEAVIRGTIQGDSTVEVDSEFKDVMLKWIAVICGHFAGSVIRRTVHSVDNNGTRVSGLESFHEHILIVQLYQHELDNLNQLAQDLWEEGGQHAAKFSAGKVKNPALIASALLTVFT
jgi:hypothetical protein